MSSVRHFLKDTDLSPDEQRRVLDMAVQLKAERWSRSPLAGPQTVAVIFDKTSTRTRLSFATGVADLGGHALIISPGEAQMGHKETIEDSAKVFSRMVAAVVWRTFAHADIEEFAAHSTIPVVNSLTDDYHPCQILADLLTIREHKGKTEGLNIAYLGDAANNMANSYLLGCVNAGMHVRIAGPEGYLPAEDVVAEAQTLAAETGGSVLVTTDPVEALKDVDVVATDTWISMGQEDEKEQRLKLFTDYTVDDDAMGHAADDAIVLHCLPAYRGFEISESVIDGPQSVVFDEAENRLHAQKALLTFLLDESGLSADASNSKEDAR
ncbi:ornithine carbamoyltransferase [Pseudoglutamicibacter cumminsii]|uniref:ornithine carbamoyltransferase n=1 Tax=Pseudoglutamicibacter cumminsii TaxID=156979 RepID=UPI0019573DC2|nr:ornithine carbamoyltransferase [Pseudoglutamicibacter cumminsii]MBM7796523.1 ornithine carbamoyltransferase [Pseudoglutamicibacter cumminsii]